MIPNGTVNGGGSPTGASNPIRKPRVVCVTGAQWGDEGKGKIVDMLVSKGVNIVARCQGGNNAGHTVVANGMDYHFHVLPSGIIHEGSIAFIGNGVVVHLPSLFAELTSNRIPLDGTLKDRLVLSDRAHLVFDFHQMVDGIQEEEQKQLGKNIGTTKKGIGPAYACKVSRIGLRVADIMGDEQEFEHKLRNLYSHYKRQFPALGVDLDQELTRYKGYAGQLKGLGIVKDGVSFLHKALTANPPKSVLVEGANGALLDIDFGTYPYVTSSNCTVGGMFTGLGISPRYLDEVIGIVKAYQTRVGSGPMPTEQVNEIGEKLRTIGGEIGVTTGRLRRCGWLDLVLLKYSNILNGYTAFALTKLDILDTFETIKVAVAYKLKGQQIDYVPANHKDLESLELVYETFPGWMVNTTNTRSYKDLPAAAKSYVEMIERCTGVPVRYIGVGKDRNALIVKT